MGKNLKPNISCKKASFLISKKQETSISVWQHLQLAVHLITCNTCTMFKKQTDFIVNFLSKNKSDSNLNEQLDVAAKQKISAELNKIMSE